LRINREFIPCLHKAGTKLMFAANSLRHWSVRARGNTLSNFSCFSSDIKQGHSSPTKGKKGQEKAVTVRQ